MDAKKPMLWTRVDQGTADEAQALADEHYDGNVSMFVRQAVKRFVAWIKAVPTDLPTDETEEQPAA